MKKGNEAKVVASDSSKRCSAAEQTKENPDRIKNHKDCRTRYRALLEKQIINTALLGVVFGKKRVRSASDNLDRYCGWLSGHGQTTSGFQGNLRKCHFKDESSRGLNLFLIRLTLNSKLHEKWKKSTRKP